MDHQDWNPIVINKPKAKSSAKHSAPPEEIIRMKQIEDENYVIPKVSIALQHQIREARSKKGWTQKDLAARLNVKSSIINGYESGSVVPDHTTLQRLSRALDVPLKLKFPRTVSPRSNTTSNPISTIICNLKSDTIHISRQKERVCTEEERRIWEKYTTKQLEEETLRDVDLVKHRTDKSWEESLQAIVEHNWDIAHATQFLLTY